ncbi:MAG: amidohydrolase family protein [Planctomycetaceae bacterium]
MPRLLATLFLSLCVLTGRTVAQPDPVPDLILHHTHILTMAETPASAEAVAIHDGKILALGRNAEILALRGPATEVRSLRDKAVLPGFFSGPTDLTRALARAVMADCGPPPIGRVKSRVDVITELTRKQVELGSSPAEWLAGFGYWIPENPSELPLNAESLDLGFPDTPVYVLLAAEQGAVCNSQALSALGITPETADPAGGRIGRRSATADQWGVLWGTAWTQAARRIPAAAAREPATQLAALQRLCLAAGITTGWGGVVDLATYQKLAQAERNGELLLDFIVFLDLREGENLEAVLTEIRARDATSPLQVAGVAVASEAFEPTLPSAETRISSPGLRKQLQYRKTIPMADAELGRLLNRTLSLELPVVIDCQSAEGLSVLLRTLQRLDDKSLLKGSLLRTHLPLMAKDLELVSRSGLVPAFDTDAVLFDPLVAQDQRSQDEEVLGPLHQLALSRNVEPALFSRMSTTPRSAITLWHSAVNRLTLDDRVLTGSQRITPIQALRAMTVLPAGLSQRAERMGRILPGMQADLIVLDRNPYSIVPPRISRVQVLETYKSGQKLFPK